MKNVLFTIVALCMCTLVFSQETKTVKTKATNEIKVNLLMTVLSFPEISYERVWGNNTGLGLSAGVPLENNDLKFQIMPYGRFYFGESAIKSFFIEGNMAIRERDEYYYDFSSYNSKTRNKTDFGLGVAFGYKYVNSKNFLGELFFGIGRTLGSYSQTYPCIGISIGTRL